MPVPTSSTTSSVARSAASTISSTRLRSIRKFCPCRVAGRMPISRKRSIRKDLVWRGIVSGRMRSGSLLAEWLQFDATASCRSTYLARTSVSRFTRSPILRRPSVVTASVCGIRATLKRSSSTSTSVRLTPSTATEPLLAIWRVSAGGTRNHIVHQSASSMRRSTVPTASMWPVTKWPPSASPTRSDRSRLTDVAGLQFAEVGARERFFAGLERQSVAVDRDDGQAAAVERDAVADRRLPRRCAVRGSPAARRAARARRPPLRPDFQPDR